MKTVHKNDWLKRFLESDFNRVIFERWLEIRYGIRRDGRRPNPLNEIVK